MSTGRLILLLFCATLCLAEKVRYDGYHVLRVIPKTHHEISILGNLMSNLESSKFDGQLSFWREPSNVTKPVDIMISPSYVKKITTYLAHKGIHTKVMIKNVQELIDEEQKGLNSSTFDYNAYNTYETIQQWITETAEKYDTATKGSIGTSYEERNIGYLKISTGGTNKKAVVIHGGIHAREWISPATVLYLAKYLVEGGADAKDLLQKFDFYVIPVLNVDGYSFTWTDNRLWRKTRKPNEGSPCMGTDPNRNFATGWGGIGSSNEPCSDIYHGTKAFSEPEVAAIRDFVSSLDGGDGVALYIDYHSYSQLWLMPYGYTNDKPADYDTQLAGGKAACDALKKVHGTQYVYGNIYDTIYPASGGSCDYMYAKQGVQFSYSPEGRDTGTYGFILPAKYIQPSGEENWAALKAICDFVDTNI
ncbi:carboxypeptidase B-like isoform X1 [Amphiura filiformis]|uniref:carboxypeptidase B-like isoform X1 n=1 Tax=Amphiura filiformis TaxID=82378 RepID=UPI003B20C0E0